MKRNGKNEGREGQAGNKKGRKRGGDETGGRGAIRKVSKKNSECLGWLVRG